MPLESLGGFTETKPAGNRCAVGGDRLDSCHRGPRRQHSAFANDLHRQHGPAAHDERQASDEGPGGCGHSCSMDGSCRFCPLWDTRGSRPHGFGTVMPLRGASGWRLAAMVKLTSAASSVGACQRVVRLIALSMRWLERSRSSSNTPA